MATERPVDQQEWRGKRGKLDQAELEEFLGEGVLARLACLDHDGWPYVVPVWFQYADGGFYIIPRERSVWAEYLKHDPRVALTIDEAGRQRKVFVRGEAQLIEEPNVGGKWVPIATDMSYRYLGENGPEYMAPTLNEPRWLFFVRPITMRTWQGVNWPQRYKHSNW